MFFSTLADTDVQSGLPTTPREMFVHARQIYAGTAHGNLQVMRRDQRARNVANATKTVGTTTLSRLYSCDHPWREETKISRHQEGQPALVPSSMSRRREYSTPPGEALIPPPPSSLLTSAGCGRPHRPSPASICSTAMRSTSSTLQPSSDVG